MHRLKSGNWGDEIARSSLERDGLNRRWSFSLETTGKREAQRRKALLLRLCDLQEYEVIGRLRRGELSISELTRRLDEGTPIDALRPQSPQMRLEDVAARLVNSKKKSAPSTQLLNERYISLLCDTFGKQRVANTLSPQEVAAYIKKRNWASSTQNTAIRIYKNAWRLCGLQDIWSDVLSKPAALRDRVCTDDEIARLLAASEGTSEHLVIALAFIAGMRQGEITHLQPRDVDLERHRLRIREKPQWAPKTTRSTREISFAPQGQIHVALEAHLHSFASKWWLFPSARDAGSPLHSATLRNRLLFVFQRADVPYGQDIEDGVTLHTGRHSAISKALSKGVPVHVCESYFGDSAETLLSTYAHLIKGDPERVARALDESNIHPKLQAAS